MRRSTVLSFPLQFVFPGLSYWHLGSVVVVVVVVVVADSFLNGFAFLL
jgi:hypothetical protein